MDYFVELNKVQSSRGDALNTTLEASERSRLLDETEVLVTRVGIKGLPEQTSSLLDSNVTLQQFRALLLVYMQGPIPISHVAETLHFLPSHATGIIQRLVNRDMIERREDPHDRRVRMLTITDHGLALIEEMMAVVHAKRRELLDRLSDQQLHQLRDILAAMEG